MKKLSVVLLFAAMYPVVCIAGFFVASIVLEPDFEPVDLSEPPLDLAVLAAWTGEDGAVRCRAFYRVDLLRHADSVPELRFRLSDADMAICGASVDAFRRDREWPHGFSWDRRAWGVAATRPDAGNPNLFEVAYPPDDDRTAVTRYEVDPMSGQPGAFEFRGAFGPALGIGILLFGGVGGTVAWLVLLLSYVITKLYKHRRGSSSAGQAR